MGSDVQQVGVDLQGTVGVVGENLLGQNLAQLDAFLVEGVDVPCEALEHDLVLKVGQQSTQGGGGQFVADDDGAGTAALELLVQVGVILAAGKGNDLYYVKFYYFYTTKLRRIWQNIRKNGQKFRADTAHICDWRNIYRITP